MGGEPAVRARPCPRASLGALTLAAGRHVSVHAATPGENPFFPLLSAGFRCNPFRVLSPEEWREVALLPEPVARALAESGDAPLQVMGEAGRGKSTALIALAVHLERSGKRVSEEYLPQGVRTFRTRMPCGDVFCLDEAQRLTPRERARLLTGAARHDIRLILGTHEDWTPLFARRGIALRTVRLDTLDEAHFRAALERRLTWAALPGDVPRATLTEEAWAELRHRFGTDLRAAERFLYLVFQTQVRRPEPLNKEDLPP